jgi:ElaA protein
LGLDAAQLGAQTHAVGFYERFGFRVQGSEYEDAGIPHVHLTLNYSALHASPY